MVYRDKEGFGRWDGVHVCGDRDKDKGVYIDQCNEIWTGYLRVLVVHFDAVFLFEMDDLWHIGVETL